jgi:hypothetical protein
MVTIWAITRGEYGAANNGASSNDDKCNKLANHVANGGIGNGVKNARAWGTCVGVDDNVEDDEDEVVAGEDQLVVLVVDVGVFRPTLIGANAGENGVNRDIGAALPLFVVVLDEDVAAVDNIDDTLALVDKADDKDTTVV